MTEEDAKKRWCPMVRHTQFFNDCLDNRGSFGSNDHIANACIASACALGCDDEGKWLGHCGLRGKT